VREAQHIRRSHSTFVSIDLRKRRARNERLAIEPEHFRFLRELSPVNAACIFLVTGS